MQPSFVLTTASKVPFLRQAPDEGGGWLVGVCGVWVVTAPWVVIAACVVTASCEVTAPDVVSAPWVVSVPCVVTEEIKYM